MTDQELLSAIADIVEAKLEPLMQKMDSLESRMDSLESRMDSLESRMDSLESRMDSLESRMDSLESRVDSLETAVQILTERVDSLEKEVRRNSVMIENEILPRLQTIEQLYVGSSKTFVKKADQIDNLQDDVDVLKVVVQEHSEKLEKIS